jgi:hypothetical protein
MKNLPDIVKKEVRELLPVMLFFLVTFELLALTSSLTLMQHGIESRSFLSAAILALIVAKVVAIADHIPAVNRFPEKPLIFNVLWKTLIYFTASFAFRFLEKLFHLWRETGNLQEARHRLGGEVVWPHFWGVSLWLLVLLLVFTAFREMARVLGREHLFHMFFTNPAGKHPPDCGRGSGV